MEEVDGSEWPGAEGEAQNLVRRVGEDEIRHGFDEPLTEAGEGYEWAWVGRRSSLKGWWVEIKIGCTPFDVMAFTPTQMEDGTVQTWVTKQDLQGRAVVKAEGWWVAVKCDG